VCRDQRKNLQIIDKTIFQIKLGRTVLDTLKLMSPLNENSI
jgi:hypothetical protein